MEWSLPLCALWFGDKNDVTEALAQTSSGLSNGEHKLRKNVALKSGLPIQYINKLSKVTKSKGNKVTPDVASSAYKRLERYVNTHTSSFVVKCKQNKVY